MVEVTRLTLGELDTNCYLVWCPDTLECLIIDPAAAGEYVTETIQKLELKPQAIVLTHGHFDHCLGALELKLTFGIPVLLHQNDLPLLKKAQKSAEHWLHHPVDPIPEPDGFLDQNSVLVVGEDRFTVLETPGHTPGSISLFCSQPTPEKLTSTQHPDFSFIRKPLLFSGDTLFKGSVGSVTHRYSSALALSESLHALKQLPPETVVFSGHGDATTIGAEF